VRRAGPTTIWLLPPLDRGQTLRPRSNSCAMSVASRRVVRMNTPHLLLPSRWLGLTALGRRHAEQYPYQDAGRFAVPMQSRDSGYQYARGCGRLLMAPVPPPPPRSPVSMSRGKTGTAQVASNDKAGAVNKDHAWFMSFARVTIRSWP
jgi:hypothetical protein